MTADERRDIELTYWVKPGEENFAMVTALTMSRFVIGCRHDMAQPGLISIIVRPRGVERIKAFFRKVGKELICEGTAPGLTPTDR